MAFDWFSVLKIKNQKGEDIEAPLEAFKDNLINILGGAALPEFRVTSTRASEGSRVRATYKNITDTGYTLNLSFRHPATKESHNIEIRIQGDYENKKTGTGKIIAVVSPNLGPDLTFPSDYVTENASSLIMEILERVENYIKQTTPKESLGIPSVEEEEGRETTEERNRSLAESNPGYFMIDGSMRDKVWILSAARRSGKSLESYLQSKGISMKEYNNSLQESTQRTETPRPQENRQDGPIDNRPRGRTIPRTRRRGRRE